MKIRKKTGIALGGGAARGFAHLGFLEVLEKNNLKPDFVAGTSMGAIIGAAYASGKYDNIKLIEYKIIEIIHSDEFEKLGFNILEEHEKKKNITFLDKLKSAYIKFNFYRKMFNNINIIDNNLVKKIILKLIPDIDIKETKIPFAAVALDIKKGKEIILREGSLIKAVLASSAIPGILKPVKHNKQLLIDGGWVNKVPCSVVRKMGADYVIAVDVSVDLPKKGIKYKNGLELLIGADEYTSYFLTQLQLLCADMVIHPEFKNEDWYDFSNIEKFIKKGYQETNKNIRKLKSYFYHNIKFSFKNLFKLK